MEKSTNEGKMYSVINSRPYIKLLGNMTDEEKREVLGIYDENGNIVNDTEYDLLKSRYYEVTYSDYEEFLDRFERQYLDSRKQKNRYTFEPLETVGSGLLALLLLEGMTGGIGYGFHKLFKADVTGSVTFLSCVFCYSFVKYISEDLKRHKGGNPYKKRAKDKYKEDKALLKIVKNFNFDPSYLIQKIKNGEELNQIDYKELAKVK